MTKTCTTCNIEKPLEDFSPSKAYKHGRSSRCKVCTALYMKEWRANNPEKQQIRYQKAKEYRQTEEFQEWNIQHLEKTREKRREYHQQYNLDNAEHIKQRAAIYYQETKEDRDTYNAEWRHANPQRWTAIHKRWHANKKGASINDLTEDQWQEILHTYGNRCCYCNKKYKELTQDHITPLSKGGNHTASNIVPACRSCNSKKNTGPVPVPIQPLLLTVTAPKPVPVPVPATATVTVSGPAPVPGAAPHAPN